MLITKFISEQNIDKNKLSIFLRDLSQGVQSNLKHMIEDDINDKTKQNKSKHNKKNKNKVIKKKDIIIQEQNELRRKRNIKDDMDRMDFLFKNLDLKNPFLSLKNIKTDEGIICYKFRLLEMFWKEKNKYMNYIILLFFELKNENVRIEDIKPENINLLREIKEELDESEYKLYMMKYLGHMLPPLNYWDKSVKKFDKWQKDVINYINQKQNIIVRAPTSSGKSFIAMASGIIHKRIIYICPAEPVAYQVGANFINMGYKVHFLLNNLSHYSYSNNTNIFIGTPLEVEDYLNKIGTNFDYAVFDEIHNLNREEDGNIYENIIKLLPCNFLALSATIKNIEYLKDIFSNIHCNKDIKYIEYNKRFINHNRWIWKDSELKQIHPLCVFNNINDNFHNTPLQFTPQNCAVLWETIEEIFEEIDEETDILDGCSPDDYFTESRILTLDDCREYEIFLKKKLIEINEEYPEKIQEIFDRFKEDYNGTDCTDGIIDFIRKAKKKDMFPMLMFNTNENVCKSIFNKIYEYLNTREHEEYPYHYDILEAKDKLYNNYINKRDEFKENIKITSNNAQYEIKDKMETFERQEKDIYIKNIINLYENRIKDIDNTEDNDLKLLQHNNLKKEMESFILNPDFNKQDIYKKHTDFIFTSSNEPMSSETIRKVRRDIKDTLGIKIPYENPLFQMLKRGIGIYIENGPDEYNWILQKLISEKEIGIVISDRTLCLGIDLPVRTSCFIGHEENKFTKDDYLQMSGRAGRRGLDSKGNIIFYGNINYLSLMKSELPSIIGTTKSICENYSIMDKLYFNEKVFTNMINPERKYIQITNFQSHLNISGSINVKLLWFLREYTSAIHFVKKLDKYEEELFKISDNDREMYLLSNILNIVNKNKEDIINYYKLKQINNPKHIYIIKEYMNVIKHIHNNINNRKYMILINICAIIFNNFNRMKFSLTLTI